MSEQRPIVIKKIKKGHGGHHGGAWKLAYADFVTAMMAFFLLMWLLGSTTKGNLQGIAEYFQNPFKVSMSGGEGSGDAVSVLKGGGEDLTRAVGQVKRTNEGTRVMVAKGNEDITGKLRDLKTKLEGKIGVSPTLRRYKDQLRLELTREGLRIQIVDAENRPMFAVGSAQMQPYVKDILKEIAPVINELPNAISISGYTDARPFAGAQRGYSNWELSADRANTARRELLDAGLQENKVLRVVGFADSVPLVKDDPMADINRRIAIVVMNQESEAAVRADLGERVNVDSNTDVKPELIDPEHNPPARTSAPAAGDAAAHAPVPSGTATPPALPARPSIVPPPLPPGLVPARPAER